jgi:cell division protein YceG involved in septum cleavage
VAVGLALRYWLRAPVDRADRRTVFFRIESPVKLDVVANSLEGRGLIRSRLGFTLLAWVKGHRNSTIAPGEYALNRAMPAEQILWSLLLSHGFKRTFVMPPVPTLVQTAQMLQDEGFVSLASFLEAAHDASLLKSLRISDPSVEGYLFPGSYDFQMGMSAQQIIRVFVERTREELKPFIKKGGGSWSEHSLLVFASIIEKLSPNPEKQDEIAAVLRHRITLGMSLEPADLSCTVRPVNATQEPFKLWNLFKSLPKKPLTTPSVSSLEAALGDRVSDNLGIVATSSGDIEFLPENTAGSSLFARGGYALDAICSSVVEPGEDAWCTEWSSHLASLGLTRKEATIVAFIVQRESPFKDEWPYIASTILNRASKGLPLALGSIEIPTTHFNRQKTVRPELRCEPQRDAVESVLFSKHTSFLSYTTRANGRHVFFNVPTAPGAVSRRAPPASSEGKNIGASPRREQNHVNANGT